MKGDEKQIQIKIQNDNCLIYLKNNDSTLTDKTKRTNKDDILYDDDIKELSYSISNVSEAHTNKRKINLKKNFNSIEKTEFEISNISIFNSSLKQDGATLKTPLFEINNESNNKSNKDYKKENNNQNFKEALLSLKAKKLIIKKLNFDSSECDTIQETDTIKKLDNKYKNDNKVKNDLNTKNINKNLNKQFFSQTLDDIKDYNIKTRDSNRVIINNIKKGDNNDNLGIFLNKSNNAKEILKRKMNNENINNIRNELRETTKYKEECVEKYNIQLKKSKTIVHNNNIFELKCRSFSRIEKENENSQTLSIFPKQEKIKENLIYNKYIENKIIKTSCNNNNIGFKKIYKKNLKSRNLSYNNRALFSKWTSTTKKLNKEQNNSKDNLNLNKSSYSVYNNFVKKINIDNYEQNSSIINNYYINNNQSYENKFFLTNNNFNYNFYYPSLSTKNIFIKKNCLDYNNYYERKTLQITNNIKKIEQKPKFLI